ncbi:MAG: protein phosphatase 2C domain-containing protein [Brevefilum sp.]|nr:protein phosphatase 2C domain-containing protein [Brevefilum sp.]MDT8381324.1 protein phosphatase 2C domain-containing protein [Brevefilum sp.]MDW7754285.1 protein phosphatase 2C domain-containing protein [Brevefilum sp.]
MFEFLKSLFPEKKEGAVLGKSLPHADDFEDVTDMSEPKTKTVYRVASCQSNGRARTHNEDTIFTLNNLIDGFDSPVSFGIYLVADGMGGHQSGEIASSLAAQTATRYLMENFFYDFVYDRYNFTDDEVRHHLNNAVDSAQKLISQRVPGGGTTLTLVLILGDRLFFAHVGDCRLYLIGLDGQMTLKTKDHSLVKRLIDLGEITENEASFHPQRNILYRALGQNDPFEADINQFILKKGEQFLICSDGLWGVLEENKMNKILQDKHLNFEEIVCRLVNAANELGGPDNISVVLVERLI